MFCLFSLPFHQHTLKTVEAMRAMMKDWRMEARLDTIQRWKELAYGMFIHFGLYSLCGGVWNGQKVEVGYSEQILSHGPVPQADYEALKDSFLVERFDADQIVALAISAGMRYVVLTAKHHDGFCLFDTDTTDYSSAQAPCHRDLVAEMSRACKRAGLGFGVYYSWIDWHFPYALPISPHNSDRIPPLHMEYNLAQLRELLSNYGEICELWMDMGAPTREQSLMVRELAHALQPGIMVNGRVWNDCGDFLTMGDNQFPEHELELPWQTPATIYHETWSYRSWQERTDAPGKIALLSSALFSVLDRGGNYLLNIGPMADGSIVPFEREVLEGIGGEVRRRGLVRIPADNRASTWIPPIAPEVELTHATKHYRYTGGDYYSFHPIVTALSWDVRLETPGFYEISYRLAFPLEKELKLCLEYPGGNFVFHLKRNLQRFVISSKLRLPAGTFQLVMHTIGSPIERPQLEISDIGLLLRRRKKDGLEE